MTKNKDTSVIPSGISCVGKNGKLCPYYKKSGHITLNKKNCEFSNLCNKDCLKEKCKNEFYSCLYKNKTENYANSEFLLASKLKICGINMKKEE